MFEQILPQILPPDIPNPQVELQKRQLDIEEQDDMMDDEREREELRSKERIAHADNITKILTSATKPTANPPNPSKN